MLSWLGFKKSTPDTKERRQIVRRKIYLDVLCHLPVEGQLDRDFKAVITDIGPGGLKLRSYENLSKGMKFFIEYPEELPGVPWMRVKVVVCWAVKSKKTFETTVGVNYDEPKQNMAKSWVKFVLEDAGFKADTLKERRQTIRVPIVAPGVLLTEDMEASGKIVSLSMGGAQIETPDPISQGRECKLIFKGTEFKGMTFPGSVLDVKPLPAEKTFVHSIVFKNVTGDQAKALASYLQRYMRETAPK